MPDIRLTSLLLSMFVVPALAVEATAEPATDIPAELQARADALQLHADPQWLRLGHYRETWGGYESEIDGEDFFIADDGKEDPQAELQATLAAWFGNALDEESSQPLRCRFQARYAWLDSKLDLHAFRAPPECADFDEWFNAIDPGSITLVFPSSYLNNPASMYGHTLLRIDPPEERSQLASYAINFAARTNERNGFVFAVKGLTGMYDGYFALLPYYRKVNEYNDIENRDIWEYPLDLDRDEIRQMLRHLWEVGPASIDYFFFDENCSYQLLTLVEVARPGLELVDDYSYQVIPADTVRQLLAETGMVDAVKFRAALATRLDHQATQMTDAQLQLAQDIATGKVAVADAGLDAMDDRDAARVLDMSYLLLQYRHFNKGGEQQQSSALALPILRQRAEVDAPRPFAPIEPPDSAPHRGHGSSRLAIGVGEIEEMSYSALSFRAAYHDLLDPYPGFLRGAAITMFGGEFRKYEDSGSRLQRFDLVQVESLSPRGRLMSPLSWRVAAGWNRDEPLAAVGGPAPLAFTLGGGPGMSWDAGGGLLSLQLNGEFRYHDSLPGNQSWAVAPRAVYAREMLPGWTLLLEAGQRHFTSGLEGRRDRAALGQQWMLAEDIGLRLSLEREWQDERAATRADLRLMLYY